MNYDVYYRDRDDDFGWFHSQNHPLSFDIVVVIEDMASHWTAPLETPLPRDENDVNGIGFDSEQNRRRNGMFPYPLVVEDETVVRLGGIGTSEYYEGWVSVNDMIEHGDLSSDLLRLILRLEF